MGDASTDAAPGLSPSVSPGQRPPDRGDDRPLVLDELAGKLDQFRLFRDSDGAATDRVLDELGAQGRVEMEMVVELAAQRTLAHPERFAEAHGIAMRALEVLDRNGARAPSSLRLGIFTPVARWGAQLVCRYIVRSHQNRVVDAIRNLYARRLAWCPPGSPDRLVLLRARADVERAAPAYKKRPNGVPTFLLGGAVVSTFARVAGGAVTRAIGSSAGLIVAAAATFVLLAGTSWVILRGAAVARRRIRLSMDRPLHALWETIGRCGEPPEDSARLFALVGITLTTVGWLLIPAAGLLIVALF